MGMTIVEKILANHSGKESVAPGEIIDVTIDARVARDFGGANVVKNIEDFKLSVEDPSKTFFTFDCNPTGSDQNYAINQQICRLFARKNGIKVYDIDKGIGTHILIEEGLAYPGSTAVSTDSHANILGAVGSFGQGMGDIDIAAAWAKGKVWFKVPESVKFYLKGKFPKGITSKDIVLNLLSQFGANSMLGYSIEIYGDEVDSLGLDDRITISSMATEMGAIIILFTPNRIVQVYCEARSGQKVFPVFADDDANYAKHFEIDVTAFKSMVSRPGKPHDAVDINKVRKVKIDSAFIGSCTNGRIEDMRITASILKGRKVAPGVVLKIVPSTDLVWRRCLDEGLLEIFKDAGAMVSNAGCAGCAAGQVGQNGYGEVTISTGNRNFTGKQGKGDVYLASPGIAAASAIAGYITSPDQIPDQPVLFSDHEKIQVPDASGKKDKNHLKKPDSVSGKVWNIAIDNIDTDIIFHNRYLTITKVEEMGRHTFDNLPGFTDFALKAKKGDIVVVGKNFGSGSSRQQAVDCFTSLGIQCIIAESFGAIYERNAINAAFPIVVCDSVKNLKLENGNEIEVDFLKGKIINKTKKLRVDSKKFSEVQMEIYRNDGLF
jgi:homoaconitate hydratase family protein/3-isopropylmalate dehydratase small subunit